MEYAHLILLLLVQLASYAQCSSLPKGTGNPPQPLDTTSGSDSPGPMIKGISTYFNPQKDFSKWIEYVQREKFGVATINGVPRQHVEQTRSAFERGGFSIKIEEGSSNSGLHYFYGHSPAVSKIAGDRHMITGPIRPVLKNRKSEIVAGYNCDTYECPVAFLFGDMLSASKSSPTTMPASTSLWQKIKNRPVLAVTGSVTIMALVGAAFYYYLVYTAAARIQKQTM